MLLKFYLSHPDVTHVSAGYTHDVNGLMIPPRKMDYILAIDEHHIKAYLDKQNNLKRFNKM